MQIVAGWEVAEKGGGRWREGQVAEMWCGAQDSETEGDSIDIYYTIMLIYLQLSFIYFQVSIPAM